MLARSLRVETQEESQRGNHCSETYAPLKMVCDIKPELADGRVHCFNHLLDDEGARFSLGILL